MNVLVDTSVWVDFFRGGMDSHFLKELILENLLVTNDLILTEIIPFLKLRGNNKKVIELLNSIRSVPLQIDWVQIQDFQLSLLKRGINGVGIPDLIIFQNAKNSGCLISAFDFHFERMCEIFKWQRYPSSPSFGASKTVPS